MSKRTTILCDQCGNEINDLHDHVDASVYGSDFHYSCLEKISALRVLKILELDDITVGRESERLIYSIRAKRFFAMEGTHIDAN